METVSAWVTWFLLRWCSAPPTPAAAAAASLLLQASQALANISGQLQAAAALIVELARAASASSVELQGSNPLLTANTAAVLQQEGGRLVPAFPTLYPQLPEGLGGARDAGEAQLGYRDPGSKLHPVAL
jgi:hypothetical protein